MYLRHIALLHANVGGSERGNTLEQIRSANDQRDVTWLKILGGRVQQL